MRASVETVSSTRRTLYSGPIDIEPSSTQAAQHCKAADAHRGIVARRRTGCVLSLHGLQQVCALLWAACVILDAQAQHLDGCVVICSYHVQQALQSWTY